MSKITSHELKILREIAGLEPPSPWGAWVGTCLEFLKGNEYIEGEYGQIARPTKKGLLALLSSGPIKLQRWDWPSARELEAEGKITLTQGDCPNTRTASLKPGAISMSQLSASAKEMLAEAQLLDGIEVNEVHWPFAEEIVKAGLGELSIPRGPQRSWKRLTPTEEPDSMSHHPSAPIVGMFFRPPAKAILAVLPADCPLHLEPEPTNTHDPNAIAVMVESRDIPATARSALEETCPPMGFTADDIFEAPGWHLGYIKRDFAEELAPAFKQLTGARLGFDPAGKPLAILEWQSP